MDASALDAVTGRLKFVADLSAPLAYVASKGGGDQTRHLGNFHTREIEIRNARRHFSTTDLDREGFMLVAHDSAVDDFYDDEALRRVYHAELAALIRSVTGAERVDVFDDTRRSSSVAQQRARGIREPANVVHNDYSAASGPKRRDDVLATTPDEAPRLRARRFAIVNVWRPIAGTVVDQPLALCDASTVEDGDLVPVARRGAHHTGEIQVARHDPGQRWYFYPDMHPGEVLLFKTYDSSCDGRARFTPHSAFECPAVGGDAPPRESLESRCLVWF